MKILLDTHVFIWWLSETERISAAAREAIANQENVVYVSAVVAWEIAIKRGTGQLEAPGDVDEAIRQNDFEPLPVSVAHALAVEKLPGHHKDPFDRLLIAQAMLDGLTLVTHDREVRKYPIALIAA